MINEEQERDRICEKVFQAVVRYRKTDVSSRIRDILKKEKHYSTLFSYYEMFIYWLMIWTIRHRKEEEATDLFKNTFYGDPKLKEEIPIMACRLVGLNDVVYSSFDDNKFINQLLSYSDLSDELMIVGQTGTGKQLFARALHLMGNRNKKPFQEINCAAIPEQMLESELFGHEKGAFTDAKKQKNGLLELAGDGIIFLDELGKMSKRLQAKLLKVIQDKEFRRLGGDKILSIKETRFISAVQPDDLKNDNILPDLKYRFGYPDYIKLPTLNERLVNAHPKSAIFSTLNQVKRSMGVEKSIKIKNEIVKLLCDYDYKGNYRELYSILRKGLREALMDNRDEILPGDVISILDIDKNNFVQNAEYDLDSIKLKDVFSYAEDIKKTIVEKKISRVLKSGKNIKTALSEEGLNQEKDYQNFRKKVVNITGKNLKNL